MNEKSYSSVWVFRNMEVKFREYAKRTETVCFSWEDMNFWFWTLLDFLCTHVILRKVEISNHKHKKYYRQYNIAGRARNEYQKLFHFETGSYCVIPG
jgi:hypothetical protein